VNINRPLFLNASKVFLKGFKGFSLKANHFGVQVAFEMRVEEIEGT